MCVHAQLSQCSLCLRVCLGARLLFAPIRCLITVFLCHVCICVCLAAGRESSLYYHHSVCCIIDVILKKQKAGAALCNALWAWSDQVNGAQHCEYWHQHKGVHPKQVQVCENVWENFHCHSGKHVYAQCTLIIFVRVQLTANIFQLETFTSWNGSFTANC